MSDQTKGPMTDEEIYMLASEHEYEHGTDMFGFARALLALAGDRLHEELKYSMSHDTANAIHRILGVKP